MIERRVLKAIQETRKLTVDPSARGKVRGKYVKGNVMAARFEIAKKPGGNYVIADGALNQDGKSGLTLELQPGFAPDLR
jgi:hypothetical protein